MALAKREMDPDLLKQQQAFKKTLQSQPILKRHIPVNSALSLNYNQTSVEQSNSSAESLAEELRFEPTDIRHVNSYVHAIISTLKVRVHHVFYKLIIVDN